MRLANDLHVPAIGLGTWPLTGKTASETVSRALSNGYRHVDTARNYENEEAVGQGIADAGLPRDELWVTSKFNRANHSRAGVRQAYEHALGRLRLDYLDLFLVHWPNPDLGHYVEACQELQELVDSGQLRAWGVSNFKASHLQAVYGAGLRPVLNQVQVDPHHLQAGLLAHHDELNLLTAAYSPLGRGGSFLEHPAITIPAARHGKTPAQIVLRWHLDSGRIALPKSANETRQRENLNVFDFALSQTELRGIDSLDTGAGPRLDSDEYGH
ncbi:aldo/keto reductase [Glutamicibacter sp. V16R2B1]|uniref:aldo/keto reductase n=1 Tax=Glutamicibacter sp. V16R2B1 TaxID=2036207 RepID=UPI002017C3EB|nr:aldo/keto reductase [Glutamicibacter sp. V16R2B1]